MHVNKGVKVIPASITWTNSTGGIAIDFKESESLEVIKNYHLKGKKILKSDFQSFFNVKGQRGQGCWMLGGLLYL